jgi:hypothetical protein
MEIATYKYQRKEGVYPFTVFVTHTMKVKILEDTGKRLRIEFLGYHADGRTPGTVTTVEYKSVKRMDAASRSGKSANLQDYLDTLDPELIRKPYKDD